MNTSLFADIECLKGVGKATGEKYHKIGISSPYELIYHIPRNYLDFRAYIPIAQAEINTYCVLKLKIISKGTPKQIRKGLVICRANATDGTDNITITIFNNVYTFHALQTGETYYMYGKINGNMLQREITSPVYVKIGDTALIQPIYRLTQGLTVNTVRANMRDALDMMHEYPFETLSFDILQKYQLTTLMSALENIHFPQSSFTAEQAKRRLSFDELLKLQLGMLIMKAQRQHHMSFRMDKNIKTDEFTENLPFKLTDGQADAIAEIIDDMCRDIPMNRLLQGDVGSGKTAVASAICYFTAKNGFQSAVMAPTSILAIQHAKTFTSFLEPLGIKVAVLTSATTAKNRTQILKELAGGEIDVLVGTHAIIQKDVEYKSLGLVITDEQHRFGVSQRTALAEKSDFPHKLVMSATPIPRTLALNIYGDLDISSIKQLPNGRTPIKTYAVTGKKRDGAFGFIRDRLNEGRQAYIVCPMIEDNENDLFAVKTYAENAKKSTLNGYTTALLHGKMKSAEKEEIMEKFSNGEIQVLICTTVVEVGVDVPNAVVILIENAERFGLSQLHQLRGRVGRGKYESSCILITDNKNDECINRMKIMCRTTDGFEIAEEDLKMRGPGDFFGNAQHGLPPLKIADAFCSMELSETAKKCAEEILADDPKLEKSENHALKMETIKLFNKDFTG
ncbi:MAG: ATP-dependent DNA helicase RecG [Ruminococcus sp.]|nr:ATP-dependent DNA helicase RecG [Ruminococcus sp.]